MSGKETSGSKTPSVLASARYGKEKIRVCRVFRRGVRHDLVEYNVSALLEGEIGVSYTHADNSVVVATDSIKNITYYLAKVSEYVMVPELFALHLGVHLLSMYAHMRRASIVVEQLRWTRLPNAGPPPVGGSAPGSGWMEGGRHGHAFVRDGEDKRVVRVEVDASSQVREYMTAKMTSGFTDLLVLKTTGSAFEGFIRDEYTTLTEVKDRIFSTAIDVSYTFAPLLLVAPQDARKLELCVEGDKSALVGMRYSTVAARVMAATLDVFASDESASVQATLYRMAERVLAENEEISDVTYQLPNKHYVPVDMRYLGVENVEPLSVALLCSLFLLLSLWFDFDWGFGLDWVGLDWIGLDRTVTLLGIRDRVTTSLGYLHILFRCFWGDSD